MAVEAIDFSRRKRAGEPPSAPSVRAAASGSYASRRSAARRAARRRLAERVVRPVSEEARRRDPLVRPAARRLWRALAAGAFALAAVSAHAAVVLALSAFESEPAEIGRAHV